MPPYLQPLTTAEKFQHGYPATAPQLDWQSTHTSFYSFSSMRSAEYSSGYYFSHHCTDLLRRYTERYST